MKNLKVRYKRERIINMNKTQVKKRLKTLIELKDSYIEENNTKLENIEVFKYEDIEDRDMFKPSLLKYQFIIKAEQVDLCTKVYFENLIKAVAETLKKEKNMYCHYDGAFKDKIEETKLDILISDDYLNEGFGDGICNKHVVDGIEFFIKIRPRIPTAMKYKMMTEKGKKFRVYLKPYKDKNGEEKVEKIYMPHKSVKKLMDDIVIDIYAPAIIDIKKAQIERTKQQIESRGKVDEQSN